MPTLQELIQPISPDNACGDDPAYEPEFETAKREAEKISENDWKAMEAASSALLTQKAKDMRVLGFYCLSTALTKGLNPFAEAVQAYSRLVTEHWDKIHPKRENGRANALRWLNEERVISLLSGLSTSRGDYEALNAASEALRKMQAFCDGKFPGGAPPFTAFSKIVHELAQNNKPREEAPAEAAPAQATAAAAATPSNGGIGSLATLEDCLIALQNVSAFLLSQNPTSSLAYRLSRTALWEGIQGNIPAEGGVTLIPPPYSGTAEAFQAMLQQSQWAELVKSGEETLTGDGMFLWLDLQRYICAGLKGLGGGHAACAKAVMQELAQLLSRSPTLPELKFNDGTPFADAMTREWLETEVKASTGGGGGMPAIKKKGDVGEEQKQASALLEEGKIPEALNVLRTGLANDSNRKNNFDRKLLLAEMCYKSNKIHIAHSILEELRGQIAHHDLETWDPETCLQVYRLTQKTSVAMAEAVEENLRPGLRSLALEAHAKISRLDPVLAFQTDPPA